MNSNGWTTFLVLAVSLPTAAIAVATLLADAGASRGGRQVGAKGRATTGAAPFTKLPEAPVFTPVPSVEAAPVAARLQISVEPRPDGRWAVQKAGTQRASRVFDRKQDAVDRARAQAEREKAELVIKGEDGRTRSKDPHGPDAG